jgi:hypothetical protein
LAFNPLFRGHRSEQAQVISLDCESAALRLKVTSWAMLVQDERGRFPGKAGGRDFLDNLTCFREVVGDPDGLCAVAIAVNEREVALGTSTSPAEAGRASKFWAVEDVITRSCTASGHVDGPVSPLAIKLMPFGKCPLIQIVEASPHPGMNK